MLAFGFCVFRPSGNERIISSFPSARKIFHHSTRLLGIHLCQLKGKARVFPPANDLLLWLRERINSSRSRKPRTLLRLKLTQMVIRIGLNTVIL